MRSVVGFRFAILVFSVSLGACGGGGGSGALDTARPADEVIPQANVFADLGWSGALQASYEREAAPDPESGTLPFKVPTASAVAKSIAKLASSEIPVAGGVVSEVVDLFWPVPNEDGALEALLAERIDEALADADLTDTLEDARTQLRGVRNLAELYRARIRGETTAAEQFSAWDELAAALAVARPFFEIERFRVELTGLFSQLATLEVFHLSEGVEFMSSRWGSSAALIADTESALEARAIQASEHVRHSYYIALLRAGNAEAELMTDEWSSRSFSDVDHRLDQAQRLWTVLNRVRREFTLDAFDFSDVWESLRKGEDGTVRLTRRVYSDPVGYLPSSDPRESGLAFFPSVRTSPFGVDGSLMEDVRTALIEEPTSIKAMAASHVIYPSGARTSDVVLVPRWIDLPGLQWVSTESASQLAEHELLSRLEIRSAADGHNFFRMNDRNDPAGALLRSDLVLPAYDVRREPFVHEPLEVSLTSPVTRVVGTTRRFVEFDLPRADSSTFDGRWRAACSITFELQDHAGGTHRVPALLDADRAFWSGNAPLYKSYTVDEAFEFAIPEHVLHEVITVDAENPYDQIEKGQAVIFAFRRADSFDVR